MVKKHTNMDPVVHFEMPAEDRKRMADFYANVFGWKQQFSVKREKNIRANFLAFIVDKRSMRRSALPFFRC